jgi:hypothetical protein
MLKKACIAVGLEILAVLLGLVQSLGQVHTDEAKYLLNIPYPHPPLARWALHLIDAVPFQELFWRVVFASFMVQAVWFVWDMGRELPRAKRFTLAGSWLLSSGVLLQAGTVLLAPLTALHILIFLWLMLRPDLVQRFTLIVALLWFEAVFTTYQALLFLPLVLFLFFTTGISRWKALVYVCVPVALLGLYTLTNPLVLQSMVLHAGRGVDETLLDRTLGTLRVWGLGGSFIISALGTVGLLLSGSWGLIGSFVLLTAYVALSRYDYYMILFTPLFVAGLLHFFSTPLIPSHSMIYRYIIKLRGGGWLLSLALALVVAVSLFPPDLTPSPAREVMQEIYRRGIEGTVLIAGAFGHEWQYESMLPLRRYRPHLLESAEAAVCLTSCAGIMQVGWSKVEGLPIPVWLRPRNFPNEANEAQSL